LKRAQALGIEPKEVAKTLMFAVNRELMEHSFFHADPHPANLVVLPNNRICFIDFGAVGRFSTQMRSAWREINFHMARGDVGRMVNAALQVLGAVPPIEVERFIKAAEEIYAEWLYAVTSTDAEWWERSSSQPWLRYINLTREFGVPVSLDTIQFFRATLLHDSIVTRLDRNVDYRKPWQRYARRAAKEARRRMRKEIRRRLFGPTDEDYMRIEQITETLTQFVFRLQRTIDSPIVYFQNIVGKIAYVASLVMRLGYVVVVGLGVAFIADFIAQRWFGRQITWAWLVETMASLGWIQVVFVVLALLFIRRILIRLSQPDTKPD
jgi:predicted unusual protein kinase regulating ubiquinone biosynthesis (AarF/ABC1/UbiB family)